MCQYVCVSDCPPDFLLCSPKDLIIWAFFNWISFFLPEWDRSRFTTNNKEKGGNPTSATSSIVELCAVDSGRPTEACAALPRQLGGSDGNYSTLKNTRYAVATFERWLVAQHGDDTKMEEIAPVKLDAYLVEFFLTAKRSTGEDYRAGSIRLLRERFERHLKLYSYPHSLVYSEVFTKSQQAFKERKRQLKDLELSGGLGRNKWMIWNVGIEAFWPAVLHFIQV